MKLAVIIILVLIFLFILYVNRKSLGFQVKFNVVIDKNIYLLPFRFSEDKGSLMLEPVEILSHYIEIEPYEVRKNGVFSNNEIVFLPVRLDTRFLNKLKGEIVESIKYIMQSIDGNVITYKLDEEQRFFNDYLEEYNQTVVCYDIKNECFVANKEISLFVCDKFSLRHLGCVPRTKFIPIFSEGKFETIV